MSNIEKLKESIHEIILVSQKLDYLKAIFNNDCIKSIDRYVKYLNDHEYLKKYISYDFMYDYKVSDDFEVTFKEDGQVRVEFSYDHGRCDGYGTTRFTIPNVEMLNTDISDEEYNKLFLSYKEKYDLFVVEEKEKDRLQKEEEEFERLRKELGK